MEINKKYIGFYEEFYTRTNKGVVMLGKRDIQDPLKRKFSWEGKQEYTLTEELVLNKGNKKIKLQAGLKVMSLMFPLTTYNIER